MSRKLAIFDPIEQNALLGACQSDNEYIPLWLMLNCGMHPSDVAKAKDKLSFQGQFLIYKRAKNEKPRREMIPKELIPRIQLWLKKGKKRTRQGYYYLIKTIGKRIGHPEYTPMTLRHTFCINQLRYYNNLERPPPNIIDLVATKMGCSREVVIQNYIDLDQWEKLAQEGS